MWERNLELISSVRERSAEKSKEGNEKKTAEHASLKLDTAPCIRHGSFTVA
jgi:hypothetical protein